MRQHRHGSRSHGIDPNFYFANASVRLPHGAEYYGLRDLHPLPQGLYNVAQKQEQRASSDVEKRWFVYVTESAAKGGLQ